MEIAIATPDYFFGSLQKRMLSHLSLIIEDWSSIIALLTAWEQKHLLDNPKPKELADHKEAIEHAIKIGRWLALTADRPDFPDRELSGLVSATLATLQDKLRLWHGPQMPEDEAERILARCFPE